MPSIWMGLAKTTMPVDLLWPTFTPVNAFSLSGEGLTRSAQSSSSVYQVRDAKVTTRHISLTVSRIYAPVV